MMSNPTFDSDSEDELPPGWEERVTTEGKVYYANHQTQDTQWKHPVTGKKKLVTGELPYGWERKVKEDGTVYFADHINHKTTYTDPRLAFAEEVKDTPLDFRQKFDGSSTALQILQGRDLSGKFVLITGANCGIGFETARSLALHGATVVMACRNMDSAREKRREILKERPEANIELLQIDLCSLRSVKSMADIYLDKGWPLHILILNAGVFALGHTVTEDGFETTFQVNHLAQFFLTRLLTKRMVESAPARIVVVSSESHRFADLTTDNMTVTKLSPNAGSYWHMNAYNNSKLCNILMACQLQKRLSGVGVTASALHPGNMVSSSLSRYSWFYRLAFLLVRPFTKSLQQAAATSVWAAAAPDLQGVGGLYYNNCCRCPAATDPRLADQLWRLSDQLVQAKVNAQPEVKATH